MKYREYIYLASPYTHPNPIVRWLRCRKISQVAGHLIDQGVVLFAPISQSATIAKYSCNKKTDWEYWKEVDYTFLSKAAAIWVVMMDGWKESVGVSAEVRYAKRYKIPVFYVDPDTLEKLESPLMPATKEQRDKFMDALDKT